MDLYEQTLNYRDREVYKLCLRRDDPTSSKLRLVIKDFPISPLMVDTYSSLFFGVEKCEVSCKDAAHRIYLKRAKNPVPITPFFENLLVAEEYMKATYGKDWLAKYSVVYMDICRSMNK